VKTIRSWSQSLSHEKESCRVGTGAILMKTKSSGAGPGGTFMKRRAPEPDQELRHFYDGSATLKPVACS